MPKTASELIDSEKMFWEAIRRLLLSAAALIKKHKIDTTE